MSIGFTELILILVVVVLVFGTSKLRNMGGDLGAAVRNFKTAMKQGEADGAATDAKPDPKGDSPKQ